MKFFGKRTKLGLSLGLSLLGVLVASISTAAWFQRTVVDTHEFDDDQAGTTGTSTVTTTEVNSYKYAYDSYGYENPGTSGTVVGNTPSANIDQGIEESLDLASQGVGFYVVGDSKFTGSSSTAWKFTGARKMDDKYEDNYARIQLTLTSGTQIQIKEHTYENALAVNRTMTSYGSSSYSSNATMDGEGVISIVNPGTFDFYVNYKREVVIGAFVAAVSPKVFTYAPDSITRKNYTNSGYNIYVNISKYTTFGSWTRCTVYWFNDAGDSNCVTYSSNVATIPIPSACVDNTGTIYVKGTNENGRQVNDNMQFSLTYDPSKKNLTCYPLSNSSGVWAKFYVVGGDGTVTGWNIAGGIEMSTNTTDDVAFYTGKLSSGTSFKVIEAVNGTINTWYDPASTYTRAGTSAVTKSNGNLYMSKTANVTVYLKTGSPSTIYVEPSTQTVTFKYKIYNSTDSAAVSGSWLNYSTATQNFYSGDSVSAIASPTCPSGSTYKWIGAWYTNEAMSSSYSATNKADDFTLYTRFLQPITISYKYKIYTSNNSAAVSNDWITYQADATQQTGTSVSAPASPSIGSNRKWCGTWYTDTSLSTPFVAGTKTSNVTLYTKFYESITITLKYKIYDSTGVTPVDADWSNYVSPINHETDYSYSAPTGSKTGYTWCGTWYTNEAMSSPYTSPTTLNTNTILYTKFLEVPFNVTIQVGYAQNRSATPTFDGNTSRDSKTFEASAGTSITTDLLDTESSSLDYDSSNYDFVGYYKTLSSTSAGGTFSNLISSSTTMTSAGTIWKVYRPKGFSVYYKYEFWVKNALSGASTKWTTGGPSISNQTISGRYYGESFNIASHTPSTTSYIASDNAGTTSGHTGGNGVYKFDWDNKLYKSDGTEFTTGTSLTGSITLTVKLIASYEVMNVIVRTTDEHWHSPNDLYLNVITSRNFGSGELPLEQRSDESWYYRITNGITYQIKNNNASSSSTDYTDNITSRTDSDSDSKSRNTYHDAIEILNTDALTGSSHRKWNWSFYFGNEAKSASIFKNGSSTGITMYRGDGINNMMVKDNGVDIAANEQFGIRLYNDGAYIWYGFDEVNTVDDSSIYVEEGSTASNLGDSSNKNSTIKMIKFKSSGTYSFYLTADGKVSIASIPSTKGEGYYIMPYSDSAVEGKNTNTATYSNGVKLRTISGATDGQNQAMYTHFYVDSDGAKYYMRSFIGGVDYGIIKNLDTNSYSTINSTTGIITFAKEGYYDLYVAKSGSTMTIYVAHSDISFNALNSFKNTSDTVKNNNTSLVIEIGFKVTSNLKSKMGIMLTRSASSTGLSNYLMFSVYCSGTTKLGKSCYSTMRDSHYSGSTFGSGKAILNVIDNSNPITNCDGSTVYYLYVLIDYKDLTIKDNTSKAFNDFNISLIARSY